MLSMLIVRGLGGGTGTKAAKMAESRHFGAQTTRYHILEGKGVPRRSVHQHVHGEEQAL
jgi:hypothetical protein